MCASDRLPEQAVRPVGFQEIIVGAVRFDAPQSLRPVGGELRQILAILDQFRREKQVARINVAADAWAGAT